jgi:hypothetical protein
MDRVTRRRVPLTRRKKIALAAVVGTVSLCCGLTGVAALVADPEPHTGGRAAPSSVATPAPTPADPAPPASTPAGDGAPPTPRPEVQAAYLADLNAIDDRIVGSHSPETMVSRGRSQCDSIQQYPNDRKKLVDLTNYRFTAPSHPNGFGTTVAEQILTVVHTHLCPAYPMAAA